MQTTQLTSKSAYDSLPDQTSLKERIIQQIALRGGYGTSQEVASELGLNHDCIWKRMGELAKENRLKQTELAKKNTSGRLACIFSLPNIERLEFKPVYKQSA